jgi:hypothetical protein
LSSDEIKFGICGIGRDPSNLVEDHNSVERLLEEGAIHVKSMPDAEIRDFSPRQKDYLRMPSASMTK